MNTFKVFNFCRDKAQHGARRKLGASPYSLQSVTSLELLIIEKADMLVERLVAEAASSPSGVADALKLCGLFSFEVVCKAGFAKDFFEGTGDDSQALLNAMDGSAMTMIFDTAMPWLRKSGFATLVPGQIGKSYRSRDFWESKSRDMVAHSLAHSKETDIYLLTSYVRGTDGVFGRSLVEEEIVEKAIGIMFAGSGTTSTTLTYLLYAISRPENRHIQQRLREELKTVPNNITSIRNLPFMNAIIKETFHLYLTIFSTLSPSPQRAAHHLVALSKDRHSRRNAEFSASYGP